MLPGQPSDLRGWLADGAAFDAAGADALWLDPLAAADPDRLVLLAALAAVTYRSLLVTTLPGPGGPLPAPSGVLNTIDRLSGGRLRILSGVGPGTDTGTGPRGEVGRRSTSDGRVLGVLRRVGEEEARGEPTDPDQPRNWVAAAVPDGRATWYGALLAAAERRVHGVVVPADPRLLDMLRNPEDPGGRADLQLAMG